MPDPAHAGGSSFSWFFKSQPKYPTPRLGSASPPSFTGCANLTGGGGRGGVSSSLVGENERAKSPSQSISSNRVAGKEVDAVAPKTQLINIALIRHNCQTEKPAPSSEPNLLIPHTQSKWPGPVTGPPCQNTGAK